MKNMNKQRLLVAGLLLGLMGAAAEAGEINVVNADWTVNTAVPVGSLVGITTAETFTGLRPGPIADVSVALDISGGFNGTLYGYLNYQGANGSVATEVLLNQVGTSPLNPVGSPGAGFNDVVLTDAGTANGSIHGAAGVPTGDWLPDSPNTLDGTFGGRMPNGTWTLFLADLDAGTPAPTLVSWGLDVNVVPDQPLTPAFTAVLLGLMTVGGSMWRAMRRQVV
jgi:hypothetical protein